ncbi:MAG: hypothetical protein N2689_04570 [Verrucomicrobiae bacterium]|nr:hypothetical protein [Verrucomicrobiae bacterium]
MKTLLLMAGVMLLMTAAESRAQTNLPPFAAEWRVTGFVRQGQHKQASMERSGLRPRFVKEGDRLPGDIVVLDVRYEDRSVVIGKGKETAVIRQESVMLASPAPSATAVKQGVTPGAPRQPASVEQTSKLPAVDKPTAMRTDSGQWVIAFPNGRTLDMQSYVERHGGVQAAMSHVRELMRDEKDPERLEYRRQQLTALKRMEEAGVR